MLKSYANDNNQIGIVKLEEEVLCSRSATATRYWYFSYPATDGQGFCSRRRYQVLETTSRKSEGPWGANSEKSTESVAFSNNSSSDIDNHAAGIPVEGPLPEIEVRIPYKDILIKIHCEKRKGVLKEKPCWNREVPTLDHQ